MHLSLQTLKTLFKETLRSSHGRFSVKKAVLRNFIKFSGKHLCQSLFFNKVPGLRPGTLAQVFSCEICETSKNTFSYRTPLVAASSSSHQKTCKSHHKMFITQINFFSDIQLNQLLLCYPTLKVNDMLAVASCVINKELKICGDL